MAPWHELAKSGVLMPVYFLHEADTGRVKIGSSGNPKQRQDNAETMNSHDLVLLGTLPGGQPEERQVQALFSRYRIKREWYRAEDDVLKAIRLMLVRNGKPQTVADENQRRDGCRYGLRGVLIALRGEEAETWIALGSRWNRNRELEVIVHPGEGLPKRPWSDKLVVSMAEIWADMQSRPADYARFVPAEDCFLLTEWPVTCRCWCPTEDL